MSPSDEQELLVAFGQSVLSNTLNMIILTTGYGAFVLGMVIAILLLSRRYSLRRSPTSRGLLACLIVIFGCYTWGIFDIGGFGLTQIQYMFVPRTLLEGLESESVAQTQAQSSFNGYIAIQQYMSSWPASINVLLSDCIVVWRAWILFQEEKFRRLVLVVLMVANLGVNISDCIWSTISAKQQLQGEDAAAGSLRVGNTLNWLSITLSLVVNVYATVIIALKARIHRCFMSDARLRKRTHAQSILLLLVESGAIYCATQSVYEVFMLLQMYYTYTIVDVGLNQATLVISDVFGIVAQCYPVAVIILVLKDVSPIVEVFDQTTVEGTPPISDTALSSRDMVEVGEASGAPVAHCHVWILLFQFLRSRGPLF
ncbi:hypothetical protein EV360DRAFT_78817 [Lentinula raphanica]|nr:hypothetical protein EV360DRAFT_78817 [Lentinula raphanica]